MWIGFQRVLQSGDRYPKPVARDLHHRLKRAPAQPNSGRSAGEAFIANDAGFGTPSIFHDHYKRNQTSIWKVRKFQFSASLMQDQMVWQADVFEMRTQ
jgi:hypothetical protein